MTATPRADSQHRRAAGPTMLLWSLGCGLVGALLTYGVAVLVHADRTSVLVGIGLALGAAVLGLLLITPIARTGQLAFLFAVLLYGVQVFVMFAGANALRGRAWIHPAPLAFAALATVLAWQVGVTVGFLRARTPLLTSARVPGEVSP